ncbi:MAG: hypothetical protein CL842_02640 [Crocinitomicaceae bacterium]|nr:hypothetical protein [Crocinitomicaceae bacterium]|tara:strand:- start:33656 stop:33883 length:228 start_codon:yes stop_codon:yes gene_type:complete
MMKAKILVTLFLAISFGISGFIETDLLFQQLWIGLMVLNFGLIYKWVLEQSLKGKKVFELKEYSSSQNYGEEARN